MREHGLHTFDALHAASCGYDTMLSTDQAYSQLDIEQFNFHEEDT
jgi:hypothetical protein